MPRYKIGNEIAKRKKREKKKSSIIENDAAKALGLLRSVARCVGCIEAFVAPPAMLGASLCVLSTRNVLRPMWLAVCSGHGFVLGTALLFPACRL